MEVGWGAAMAERTQIIPRDQWVRFLDDFTREHQGWRVRIEVTGGARSGVQAQDVPLEGVSADLRGSEQGISITVGNEQEPGLTHFIPGARRLVVRRTGAGNDEALEIEAGDGSRTVLRLQQVMRAG